jgi:hypothetical protein
MRGWRGGRLRERFTSPIFAPPHVTGPDLTEVAHRLLDLPADSLCNDTGMGGRSSG